MVCMLNKVKYAFSVFPNHLMHFPDHDLILMPNNWYVSKMEAGTPDSMFSLYPITVLQ
jgi:hypothetical protein